MAIQDDLKMYEESLRKFKEQGDAANKFKISSEASLKLYTEQYNALVKECEEYAGVPMKEVSDLIKKNEAELSELMKEINALNFDLQSITAENVKAIEDIVKRHNIVVNGD